MSLTARPARAVPTLWLHPETGDMITPDGLSASAPRPDLSGALDSASRYGAARVMVAGAKRPPATWLLDRATGWDLDYCNVIGTWWARFIHRASGEKVWVRHISEWGSGWSNLSLIEARAAFSRLGHLVATLDREHPLESEQGSKNRAPVMLSPEATGLNLWALTVPEQVPTEPLATDIVEELRASLAPARTDYVIASPRAFTGYASPITAGDPLGAPLYALNLLLPELLVCKELGVGPAWRMTGPEATELFTRTPYHPARYFVRFQVPGDWAGPGLLPLHSEGRWRWPNRPGFTGQTWAGQAELRLALAYGWISPEDITEGIAFTHEIPSTRGKGKPTRPRPMDSWARLIRGLWDEASTMPGAEALHAALARIVTTTVDALGTPVEHSVITSGRPDIEGTPTNLLDGRYAHQETVRERPSNMRHPELTAQVRSGVAARLLDGPSGGPGRTGALHLPRSFYGARGPLVVTDARPDWASEEPVLGRWHIRPTGQHAVVPSNMAQATR